ncbi:hypothetical protein AVEN_232480-1 [Araneus ventricosus]|uniref:Uncharacterized protein n=1 Tax=Araneus ventricosus TaxID=182803 RepID=A0A4Y2VMC7_ARAVE|nr:hypothetical protein AVEN_232480-1 [Araneus ventricosus]
MLETRLHRRSAVYMSWCTSDLKLVTKRPPAGVVPLGRELQPDSPSPGFATVRDRWSSSTFPTRRVSSSLTLLMPTIDGFLTWRPTISILYVFQLKLLQAFRLSYELGSLTLV